MTPIQSQHERPEEHLGVEWQPKPWLATRGVSVRAASRIAGISDTSIHLWIQHGVAPLSFFKTCVMQFAPNDPVTLPKLVQVPDPFKVTTMMLAGAEAFDTHRPGLLPPSRKAPAAATKRSGGIWNRRPRAVVAAAAAPRPIPAVAPVVTPPPAPPPAATPSADIDVLLALLVQVTAQRDQLTNRVYVLETQRRTEDQLRARIAELEKQLAAYQELAEAATAPSAASVTPARVESAAAARVEKLVQRHVPTLLEELKNLPRVGVVS